MLKRQPFLEQNYQFRSTASTLHLVDHIEGSALDTGREGVELKEFIAATLTQIQEGVQDAINRRSSASNAAGVINPVWSSDPNDIGGQHIQKVEFDVAVTAVERSGGEPGIKVADVEHSPNMSNTAEQSIASRIKFTVPIVPPVQMVHSTRSVQHHSRDHYDDA
jgi:hypothetical protein